MAGLEAGEAARRKVLMPGVITQSTVLVEHPDWWRNASRFVDIVGRERVIASADCGLPRAGSNG
jgi:methionine synthase II (cobalamin-independent)